MMNCEHGFRYLSSVCEMISTRTHKHKIHKLKQKQKKKEKTKTKTKSSISNNRYEMKSIQKKAYSTRSN